MNVRAPLLGRLGVRGRTVAVFGITSLLLCGVTALTVWYVVSTYLLGLRLDDATAQATSNVQQLTTTLDQDATTPPEQLARLPRGIGSVSFLLLPDEGGTGQWYSSSLAMSREILPADLLERVADGVPARQRLEVDEDPMLVVGVPLPRAGGAYFELFPLVELEQTFNVLGAVLLAGVVIIPSGTVVLGNWALRPALRPLDHVAAVARAVASGDLGARIDPGGDPALVPIAASFNDTAAALERRVRVDAQFAADVSHELRSPLTAVLGAVSLIAEHRSSLPPEGEEMLTLLEAEVGRFARLVEDLLEISRLEAGSADLTLVEVRLAELVRHTLPSGCLDRVDVTEAGEHVVVVVDKLRMERVLANLVDNAERHGGGLAGVHVDAGPRTGVVTVEDRGPGLDDSELDRIFDRFARSRQSGRDSTIGAGLGLSLVARHLQVMQGTVDAGNRPSGGARFVVSVPAVVVTEDRG